MDTIYALSTPPGKSGVAVLRVSGTRAHETLRVLGVQSLPEPRMATLVALRQDQMLIDKALVLFFPAPHSFTGEDVVEYHIHGSRAVIRALLGVFEPLAGVRAAEPGEFARRAFLNGKLDLTAAEGLVDLIEADTEAQHKQALRAMQGEAAAFYAGLREGVAEMLALLEAYIDFPDEDIPAQVLDDIDAALAPLIASIERELAGSGAAERIRDGVRVAIIGAPNVGKSSLMNWLAQRDVAIVSHIAGTTRDVIEVEMDISGYPVILSDTAGLRETEGEIEREGIRRSLQRAEEADVRVVVVDRETVVSGQWPVVSKNKNTDHRSLTTDHSLLVYNKSDLGVPADAKDAVIISVKERKGLDVFLQALKARVEAVCAGESLYVTHSRHRAHFMQAKLHLARFQTLRTAPLELKCEELRRAGVEIGRITGLIAPDEILGRIFSRFCIGK